MQILVPLVRDDISHPTEGNKTEGHRLYSD
jgi:hypothetical protein